MGLRDAGAVAVVMDAETVDGSFMSVTTALWESFTHALVAGSSAEKASADEILTCLVSLGLTGALLRADRVLDGAIKRKTPGAGDFDVVAVSLESLGSDASFSRAAAFSALVSACISAKLSAGNAMLRTSSHGPLGADFRTGLTTGTLLLSALSRFEAFLVA